MHCTHIVDISWVSCNLVSKWAHLWHAAMPVLQPVGRQLNGAPVPAVILDGLAQHDLWHMHEDGAHAILSCNTQNTFPSDRMKSALGPESCLLDACALSLAQPAPWRVFWR